MADAWEGAPSRFDLDIGGRVACSPARPVSLLDLVCPISDAGMSSGTSSRRVS